jgi:hypothetical protein
VGVAVFPAITRSVKALFKKYTKHLECTSFGIIFASIKKHLRNKKATKTERVENKKKNKKKQKQK